jgi:hypothetical protein
VKPEIERELASLRRLAEAVRNEERNPCGDTVTRMRFALRDVDEAQGRRSEWMGPANAAADERSGA